MLDLGIGGIDLAQQNEIGTIEVSGQDCLTGNLQSVIDEHVACLDVGVQQAFPVQGQGRAPGVPLPVQ